MTMTPKDQSLKVTLTLPSKIIHIIDNKREDIPRSRFVLRLIEKGLHAGDEC
jgi:hypothetical protein